MSTTAQSEVRSMEGSKQEALKALLNSLMPNGQMALPDETNVDKLAEKLDELLASKGGLDAYTNIPRDDQGRPLNEEGLPIMEIIEPVADTNESSETRSPPVDIVSSSTFVSGQAPLSPLPNWALSPAALAARRRERDRILDILEREEEAEFTREAAATHAPTKRNSTVPQPVPATPPRTLDQVIQPSNPSSRPPAGSLPIDSSNKGSSRLSGDLLARASQEAPSTWKPKKQKSVSFVDPPSNDNDRSRALKPELDWGDVIPVQLDARKPGPAKGYGVMKELVVERPMSQPSAIANRVADSDDEDEDEELNEDHDAPEDEDSETEVPKEALGQPETSDDESDADREEAAQSIDIDDTDLDEAMLQREIALAYYARRNQMGADITSGPLFDSTAVNRVTTRGGDQDGSGETPAETSSARFRGSRLPGDPQALINSVVQFGRLVDGELVAAEIADKEVDASIDALTGTGDAGQEDMTEKMIELLRRGDTHTSNNPATVVPKPPAKQALGEASASVSLGSRSPVSQSISPRSTPKQQDIARRLKPHSNPSTSFSIPTNQTSSQKPKIPPPPTSDQPMIIESGFGFDPAFQVAPPPKLAVAKAPAPMSETVKERVMVPAPASATMPEKKRSRFAQTRASGQSSVSQQPTSSSARAKAPAAMGSNIIERVPNASSVVKPPEQPERVSRFRAERSGWM
ncbi:unnamed protein product [Rhizoctonia solani]|uniref:DUF3835 domain-containing protein n=1 Tax=Rhizoctonia solani TaxID=456999 RepID=A0A8H2Y2V7_9AGAM|nr:unnamed protein product [Rhizoctonia solani]